MRFLKVCCFLVFAVPYVSYGQGEILSVCDRTPQVREAIMAKIARVDSEIDCSLAGSLLNIILILPLNNITIPGIASFSSIHSLKAGDFSGLSSLENLGLAYNDLESLPAGLFSGLSSLYKLHLSYNNFESLPAGVFSELSSLEELYLDHNKLETLTVGVFSGLSSLKHLYLNGNKFRTLPVGVFSGLSSLKRIRLDGNNLSSLPAGIFSGLPSLKDVWLYDNLFPRTERERIRQELIEMGLEEENIKFRKY